MAINPATALKLKKQESEEKAGRYYHYIAHKKPLEREPQRYNLVSVRTGKTIKRNVLLEDISKMKNPQKYKMIPKG